MKSSGGGEPLFLCGPKLPRPMEFPGGNITVMHHFFPHLFPVSSFRLSYARGVMFLFDTVMIVWHMLLVVQPQARRKVDVTLTNKGGVQSVK